MLRSALAAALFVLTTAPSVLADETGEPIALEYQSASDCPDAATFQRMVEARTARARFVTSGQTRTFSVALTGGSHPSGELTVRRASHVEGVRHVHADTCPEAAEALVLMVALAVDPSAIVGPVAARGSAASPSATATAPTATNTNASPPVAPPEPTRAPEFVAPPPMVAPAPRESPSTSSATTPPHTLFLGTDLVVSSGVPAAPLLGVAPLLGWRSASDALISPSVRVAFLRAGSSLVEATGGSASFTWTVGRVDGCLLSWPRGPAHVLACARVEAGVLEASGNGVPGAKSAGRGWLALGPAIGGEWELLPPFFLEADVASMVRATRDRFYFQPDTTLYRASLFALEASVGIGVHFL